MIVNRRLILGYVVDSSLRHPLTCYTLWEYVNQPFFVADNVFFFLSVSGIVLSECDLKTVFKQPFSTDDTTVCIGESFGISAIEGERYHYLWNTGEETQSISVTTPGLYKLTIENYKCNSSE